MNPPPSRSPAIVRTTRSPRAERASARGCVGTLSRVDIAPAINPGAVFERVALDETSWVDIARGWLHGADAVYAHLVGNVEWRRGRVWRYERWIDEPRLGAGASLEKPGHPVLAEAQRAIASRYRAHFDGFGLAYYRDSRDSVAMHRDREMRWLDDTVVAILTLGAKRPFLVQRRSTRDASTARNLAPASGDLMVFGGRFQADWLHGVPKTRHAVRGRVSAQWRYTSKRGHRDTQPGYYQPREFSRRSSR
jgi:alkylated DNA repair dioxygenase AlkB